MQLKFRPFKGNLVYLVSLLFGAISCKPELSKELDPPVVEKPPELLEPSVPKVVRSSRCRPEPASRSLTLRAEPGRTDVGPEGAAEPVEVGNVVEFSGGFAVAILRGVGQIHAQVEWFDARGRERKVDLGVVHGGVEPPSLLSIGNALIVAVPDSDAGHSTLRLAKVQQKGEEFEVTWGPSIQRHRGDRETFSMAAAVSEAPSAIDVDIQVNVAWDSPDRSSLRSSIHGLRFSSASMKTTSPETVISPPGVDAVAPLLIVRSGGVWLLWTAYGPVSSLRSQPGLNESLVDEPPQSLMVQPLDDRLKATATVVELSSKGTDVLSFDGAATGTASLVAVFRTAPQGHPIGESPILTRHLLADGSVEHGLIEHDLLGPGAPVLLKGPLDASPWLVARGIEEEVLLGRVEEDARINSFEEEPSLDGTIPLLRQGNRLVTMRPRGLDLELSLFECELTVLPRPAPAPNGQN